MRERVHHPAGMRELLQILKIPRDEHTSFKRHVKALVASGDLISIRGHRFGLPEKMDLYVGQLQTHPAGYGFVSPERPLEAGGDIREDWDLEKALKTGDHAVGLEVLEKLYAEWKDKPVHVDLAAIWKELGVEANGGTVVLKEDAPLSAVRRAMEMGTPGAKSGGRPTSSGAGARKKDSAAASRPMAVFAGRTAKSN